MRGGNGSRSPRGVVGIRTTPVVHSLYPDQVRYSALVGQGEVSTEYRSDLLSVRRDHFGGTLFSSRAHFYRAKQASLCMIAALGSMHRPLGALGVVKPGA